MTLRPTRRAPETTPRRLSSGGARTSDERAIAALVARLPSISPGQVAVERVWRRVAAPSIVRGSGARRSWMAALAIGALALVVVGGWAWRPATSTAELALSTGGVFTRELAGSWHAGHGGERLGEADHVRTDPGGRAVFRVRDVAAVFLAGEADVALERLHQGAVLRVSRGALTARVSKRPPGEPFVVETERFTVKVVGTLFTVEEGPGEHTAVSVREGVVEVSDRVGRAERVVAGQRWSSETRETRTADRTTEAMKTLLEGSLEGRPSGELVDALSRVVASPAPGDGVPSAAVQPAAPATSSVARQATGLSDEQAGAEGVGPGQRDRSEPARTDRSPNTYAPAAGGAVARSPEPPSTGPVRSSPAAPSALRSSAMSPPVAEISPVSAPPSAPVVEDPYARGLALEAAGDFEGAAQLFARAAEQDAVRGDIALYALGRLLHRRLHDTQRARAAFSRYRARYPRGALLPEVDFGLLEIDVETHAADEALEGSTRFLATHPASDRAEEVRLFRGDLLRDAGNCRDALKDFGAVRAPQFIERALYSTAYCQRALGDRAAASATLRSYLARFPNGAHRAEALRSLAE